MRKPALTKDIEHMVRAFLMTTEMIKDAPTIEVEPVKHGRWMYPFYCSECTFVPYYSSDITYYYCPNCGARMDGKELSE
jgi:hypothetical protein